MHLMVKIVPRKCNLTVFVIVLGWWISDTDKFGMNFGYIIYSTWDKFWINISYVYKNK